LIGGLSPAPKLKVSLPIVIGAARSVRTVASLVVTVLLTACSCIHIPKQCCKRPDPVGAKRSLLPYEGKTGTSEFEALTLSGGGREWTVFVPRKGIDDPTRQPVVLLHEIPALSPGALQLALRLSDHYRVYVPLLFGGAFDNNNSAMLKIGRPLGMGFFRPSWNGMRSGERNITREISGLCRNILERHPKDARLAVIGMCLTGIIPLQLAGEKEPIPQLKGLVVSQPTIPMVTCTLAQRQSLGISDQELDRAKKHVEKANLRILGFRFQLDAVSPPERFERLNHEFGARFLDHTLLARDYVFRDHMEPAAHAVLTDGYGDAEHCTQAAGKAAYAQLVDYLDDALRN
jgi:dienelactone hydrolase